MIYFEVSLIDFTNDTHDNFHISVPSELLHGFNAKDARVMQLKSDGKDL